MSPRGGLRGGYRGSRSPSRCPVPGRWQESSPGAWTGVLGARVWTLVQERDRLWYTVYGEEPPGPHTDSILREYFQLDVGLPALYRAWGAADPHFHRVAGDFPGWATPRGGGGGTHRGGGGGGGGGTHRSPPRDPVRAVGVRVLRQDPVECLLSFICSSNNHVARITAMIERLCQAFGRRLCQLDARPFHAFPSPAALAGPPHP